jgi:chromosome segregation ATPase
MATAPLTARPYTPAPTPAASPFSAPNFATPPAISTKRTYTVPRSAAADLDSAKQQINIEKAKASALDTQLATAKQAVQDQRERVAEFQSRQQTLARQIDLDRINLDRSSQADVDTFNSNVNVYNTLLRTVRSENATANELIDAYNTLLEEAKAQDHVVNQLVDSYNATLRLNRR